MRVSHRSRALPLALSVLGFFVLLTWTAPPAAAQAEIGVRAGTLGVGVELDRDLTRSLRARFGIFAWEEEADLTTDQVTYTGDAELRHGAAFLDWHPGGGSFRFSLGAVFNQNAFEGSASIRELAEREFPDIVAMLPPLDLGRLVADVEVEPVGPYVGLGFGRSPRGDRRWGWSFDLGVVYWGEPEVDLRLDSALLDLVPGAAAVVEPFLEEERARLQEEVEDYTYYPVVSLGVSVGLRRR